MQLFSLIPLMTFGLVSTAVAIKLLLLARRTRQIPELSISLGVLLIGALGLPIAIVSRSPAFRDTALGTTLFATGLLMICVGHEMTYLFCWNVFRRNSKWARAAVASSSGMFLVGWFMLVQLINGGGEPTAIQAATVPYAVLIITLQVMGTSWSGAESYRYWGMQKRRLKLGLANPLVVERFLWWSLSNLATASLGLTLIACTLLGRNILTDPLSLMIMNVTGTVLSITWGLSFFPPKVYVRWVETRALPV